MTRQLNEAESILKLPDFKWTLERYHAMISAGILDEYDKVELLFGKLVPTSPVGTLHASTVKKINRFFILRFPGEKYTVGVQDPVTLVDDSEPEPDVYVAKGPINNYLEKHPHAPDLLLVVEVSDSTLEKDRGAKRLSYAAAGVAEYWVVNVYEKEIEQYTEPIPEEGTFKTVKKHRLGGYLTSIHLGKFLVEDLIVQ